jgi:peptidoglycan/LPS O-acetylase OafA/YrhL
LSDPFSKGIKPVSDSASDPTRVGWLDGLRGVAALQVVLLHYASAFLPAIGLRDPSLVRHGWENAFIHTPLALPFDGYAAVHLFFILSGVALTYSFGAHPYAVAPAIVRRIIRLGIPMAGGVLLGAVCFSLASGAPKAAARISGSLWLATLGPERIDVMSIIHQIGLEGLLTGYDGDSIMPPPIRHWLGLVTTHRSFNAPLWTLNIEFLGSLIVLGLIVVRRVVRRWIHLTFCTLLLIGSPTGVFGLFVVGHLAAEWLRRPAELRSNRLLGVGLCGLGILLCSTEILPAGQSPEAMLPQSPYGATALFFGTACLPGFQRALAKSAVRWLGKISFSLYLVHVPILIAAACPAFVAFAAHVDNLTAVAAASAIGWLLSLLAAAAFEYCIDRPAIRASRRVFRVLRRRLAKLPDD